MAQKGVVMKQQTGFVLISVLIITTITTMLAFSQINNNRLQERISGNQQKELNARLAAEKGIFDAFEYIKAQNLAGETNESIKADLEGWSTSDDNYYFESIELDGDTFTLTSKGEVNGAVAYLKTQITAIETNSSLFDAGVTGCDGVLVGGGGGTVDSYNSQKGDYGEVLADGTTNVTANGSVATINSGADITLSGTGEIYGSLTANGDISTGTSNATTITGDITAGENIQIKGITTSGDIHAGGDLYYKNLTLSDSSSSITVINDISGTSFSGDSTQVTYAGTDNTGLFGGPTAGIVAPDIDLGECDPVDIATVMSNINSEIATDGLTTAGSPMASGTNFIFTDSSVTADGAAVAGVSASSLDSLDADVVSGLGSLDKDTNVLIFNESLDMTSKTIEISGNVTLFVDGNITTKNTTFSFTDPDTSSLTIITTGNVTIDTSTDLFSNDTINSEGNAPLTVYSSYESSADDDYALEVTANAEMYAKLYAPLGNLALGGGAQIMGAVRGKNVTVQDGTEIHFDEALSDFDDGLEEVTDPASYSSIYYHYE
jgi:hypothetical protein